MRTTAPSQTKSFFGIDFCTRCYDALNLKDLEKKEVNGYLLSLSNESTKHFFDILVTIASAFDRNDTSALTDRCIEVLGGDTAVPEDILTILLALKALQESDGSTSLTSVGEMTLLNIAARIAPELVKAERGLSQLPDNLSEYEILERGRELFKKDYGLCIAVLDQLEPSDHSESIRESLTGLQNTCDPDLTRKEINLSTVTEGFYLECSRDMTDLLIDECGEEYTFSGWEQLKDTFRSLEEDFRNDGVSLITAEEEYNAPISLHVGEGELCLTTEWESIKTTIQLRDFATFLTYQENIPLFVLEKAAGGREPFFNFVEAALLDYPENIDLTLLYTYLLKEEVKIEEALQFLEEKAAHIPDNPELLSELADLLEENGQQEKALKTLEHLAEVDAEDWAVPLRIGRFYEITGEFRKAKEYYEKAVSLGGKPLLLTRVIKRVEISAVLKVIEELLQEERNEEALEIIDEHYDPFNINVFHYYKGLALSRAGNLREALPILKDYLDIFPEDGEGWLEQASIYLGLGQFMAAARCFRRCFTLDPDDIKPLVMEALCHKRLGRSRNYKRCINEARRIDPEGTKELLREFRS